MIDRKLLLSDFDMVLDNLRKRGLDDLGELGTLASEVKSLRTRTEAKRAAQNSLSREYAAAISASKGSTPGSSSPFPSGDAAALKARLDSIKDEIKSCSDQLKMAEDRLGAALLRVPNLLDSRTPLGRDESENLEMKRVLQPRVFDFTPKSHSELGHANGWIDSQRGVKLAKSRFSVLRGMGARLSHALISYMLDFNSERGFEICSVPVVVNENALIGTGQLPKFRDDMFKLESSYCEDTKRGHELYLISTSEVSLVNLYQDEIIPMQNLPIKLTAYTPCFRKEAGSAGRDTQGIMRQHQFDKVEIVAITSQEDSDRIQDEMVSHVSELLESLGLPHRLVQLCSGDVGFCASNTVDVEVWLPGQGCYREISSVSNCRDFQARRALIRYKDVGRNTLAHTLNGSSLAVGRTLVAIMENYQREDGSIGIPDALSKYI